MGQGGQVGQKDAPRGKAAPEWEVNGVDFNSYAGVLLDFRNWCIAREIPFREGMIRAVNEFSESRDAAAAAGRARARQRQ